LGRYLTEELRMPFGETSSCRLTDNDLSKIFQDLRSLHTNSTMNKRTQQTYLDTTCKCLDSFMDILVRQVRNSVEQELQNMTITQIVDMEFWDKAVVSIREKMERSRTGLDDYYSFFSVPVLLAEQELRFIEN
jgi:hypothetical protein